MRRGGAADDENRFSLERRRLVVVCVPPRAQGVSGRPANRRAGRPARLRAFDEQLWTFAPLEFVPHCMADSALAAQTPIVLAANLDNVPHYQVLMNLGAEVPAQFARFERLLEVVGNAQDELVAGRERYRFYRDRGYALNNYKQGG
jgi:DNA polymerase-3 subunit chi